MARTTSEMEQCIPPEQLEFVRHRLPECFKIIDIPEEERFDIEINTSNLWRIFGKTTYFEDLLEFCEEAGPMSLIIFTHPDHELNPNHNADSKRELYREIKRKKRGTQL